MAATIGYNSNKKLGRMSKETLERYNSAMHRLELGQNFRQRQREVHWDRAYDIYLGTAWNVNPDDPTADVININMAFSTINTLVPFIADEDPHFLVTPESGDSTMEHATVLEAFLNRLWKSPGMRGQTHLSDATFDYLLYGDGYMKVGYEIRMMPVYDAMGETVPNRVEQAHFHVERVNPWDIWIDPYSDGIHNARWVAQRLIVPIQELIDDDRYRVKKRDDVGGGAIDTDNISPEDRTRLNDIDTENFVTIYEFYDKRERWMMTFVIGIDAPIRYIEHVECPIIQFNNYRIPNSPYHVGDLEQMESLQNELNKTRSQMINHRRRNVGKWAINKERLSDEAIEAMKSGRINDIIPLSGSDIPIENLITYIAAPPLSADVYAMDDRIRMDINELTGVNEYLRGVPQGISRTATEATILEGATNIRTRHKLLQIERGSRDTGQMLLDVMRDVLPLTDYKEMEQYITGREAEKLNRASGAENLQTDVVITPTPEIFQGRYCVEVERGSTELRNPQVKAQKMQQMVAMVANIYPLMLQLQIPFNFKHLLELWFEAEGIDDVDALFEFDEAQGVAQQLMLMQQAGMAPGQQGGPQGQGGGGGTQPGQPREQTSQAPTDQVNPSNSGMLPSKY